MTHRVPFRHDVPNGERNPGWVDRVRSTRRVQAAGGAALPERGGTYAEIGRELGVDPGSISDWVKKADAAQASPEGNPFRVAEENRRLKREVERLSLRFSS